jgi:hypothetical protein
MATGAGAATTVRTPNPIVASIAAPNARRMPLEVIRSMSNSPAQKERSIPTRSDTHIF